MLDWWLIDVVASCTLRKFLSMAFWLPWLPPSLMVGMKDTWGEMWRVGGGWWGGGGGKERWRSEVVGSPTLGWSSWVSLPAR